MKSVKRWNAMLLLYAAPGSRKKQFASSKSAPSGRPLLEVRALMSEVRKNRSKWASEARSARKSCMKLRKKF